MNRIQRPRGTARANFLAASLPAGQVQNFGARQARQAEE
jgi:hypothetical protein